MARKRTKAARPPSAITKRERAAMLSQYGEIQDTRAGQMMVEDLVALDQCGERTARIGVSERGEVLLYCGSNEIADAVEPAVQNSRHIHTRIVPKVSREVLETLPAGDDE